MRKSGITDAFAPISDFLPASSFPSVESLTAATWPDWRDGISRAARMRGASDRQFPADMQPRQHRRPASAASYRFLGCFWRCVARKESRRFVEVLCSLIWIDFRCSDGCPAAKRCRSQGAWLASRQPVDTFPLVMASIELEGRGEVHDVGGARSLDLSRHFEGWARDCPAPKKIRSKLDAPDQIGLPIGVRVVMPHKTISPCQIETREPSIDVGPRHVK